MIPRVAVMRQRNPWEAMDAGVLMFRRVAMSVYPVLLVCGVPLVALIWLFPAGGPMWIPMVFVWWLKPVWERVSLHFLSATYFDDQKSPREIRSGLLKTVGRYLLWDLTLGRFAPGRLVTTPLRVLESADRSTARLRIRSLLGDSMGSAIVCTVVCLVTEIGLSSGVILFVQQISELMPDMFISPALSAGPDTVWRALSTLYLLIVFLLSPLFASMGFQFYVDRRVGLEGWDLELRFRQLATQRGNE